MLGPLHARIAPGLRASDKFGNAEDVAYLIDEQRIISQDVAVCTDAILALLARSLHILRETNPRQAATV